MSEKSFKKINDNPVITLGSPYGIGYEVFLLALSKNFFKNEVPVCIGSKNILLSFQDEIKIKKDFIEIKADDFDSIYSKKITSEKFFFINIDNLIKQNAEIKKIKEISKNYDGLCALKSIEIGANLVLDGYFKSLVTMPVSKENINIHDSTFKGHTEYFQKKWSQKSVFMTFISEKLNILLLSTHLSLKEVSKAISKKVVKEGLEAAYNLNKKLGTNKNICFLGLNPHAGENGLLGKEEIWIRKIINNFNLSTNIKIEGPLPADTAFTSNNINKYGLFISCYHDQGLIPFKMLSFDAGVNLSYGMKYIRTSVDHGTAVDLIGKKKANIESFKNAYLLAKKLS